MKVQKDILLNNTRLFYKLKRYKKSRSLRVHVKVGGEVTVTAPLRVSESIINGFLLRQASWILGKLVHLKQFTVIPITGSKKAHYTLYKETAREKITERVEFYNQFYNFAYNRISIKNTSSRWGSCSAKNNLNFHYKLIFLPQELLDYVVVHELCHLQEMNHGPRFWRCVSEVCPDYKSLRRQLQKHKI